MPRLLNTLSELHSGCAVGRVFDSVERGRAWLMNPDLPAWTHSFVHPQHAGLGGGPLWGSNLGNESPDVVLLPEEDRHGGDRKEDAVAAAVRMLGPPPPAKHSMFSHRGLLQCSLLPKVFRRSAVSGLVDTMQPVGGLPASSHSTCESQSVPFHSPGAGAGRMGTDSCPAEDPPADLAAVSGTCPRTAAATEHSSVAAMAAKSLSTLSTRTSGQGARPFPWVDGHAVEEGLSCGGWLMEKDGLLGAATGGRPAKSRRLTTTGTKGAASGIIMSKRSKLDGLRWTAGGWPSAVIGSTRRPSLCDTAWAGATCGGSSRAHSLCESALRSSGRPAAGEETAASVLGTFISPSGSPHWQRVDPAASPLPTSSATRPDGVTLPGRVPRTFCDPDVIVIDDVDGTNGAGSGASAVQLPTSKVPASIDPRTADTVPDDFTRLAHRILGRKKHLFVTGGGGVGKTRLLRAVLRHARRSQDGGRMGVAVVAPTGVSAANASGVTLHAFLRQSAGCFDETLCEEADAERLYKSMCKQTKERLANTFLLLIDEISMVSSRMFTFLSYSMHRGHKELNSDKTWTVVAFGDFYQLPPVKRLKEDVYDSTGAFAFLSSWWPKLFNSSAFVLKYVCCQEDRLFVRMLNELRVGVVTADLRRFIERRQQYYEENGKSLEGASLMETTHIFPLRVSVDKHNEDCLSTLEAINGSGRKVYNSVDVPMGAKLTRNALKDQLDRGLMAPACLSLAVGARVASCVTLHQNEVANGIIGTVVGFKRVPVVPGVDSAFGTAPVVSFDRPLKGPVEVCVTPCAMTLQSVAKDGPYASRYQLPLMLAWAVTIHRCQGLSMDAAVLDLAPCFVAGMVYVALSRVRTLRGVHIISFDAAKVCADAHVKLFYSSLKSTGEEFADCLMHR